jgi:hypothetical protein
MVNDQQDQQGKVNKVANGEIDPERKITRLRSYLIKLIVTGCLVLLCYNVIIPTYLTNLFPPVVASFINATQGFIKFIGLLLVSLGIVALSLRGVVLFAWETLIAVHIKKLNSLINDNLHEMGQTISHIADDLDKYIKSRGGPLSLSECKDRKDYCEYVSYADQQIYAKHIEDERSLYAYTRKAIIDSFCCEPHRSKVRKIINVTDYEHDPDFFTWKEITEYDIHHVMFKSKPVTGYFTLNYKMSSYTPGMATENWSGAALLIVRVGGETLLKNDDKPVIVECDQEKEGFFCWKEGDWTTLQYKKIIPLNTEWTDVYIEEISINSKKDRTYSLNTHNPIFGHSINFTLPEEYAFIKNPYVSPRIALRGLPGFTKDELKVRNHVTIEQNSDNHVRIDIPEWVLPGIILNLDWKAIA